MAHPLLWLATVLLSTAAGVAQPPLEIRFESEALVVDDMAAGSRLLLHGLSRERIENSFTRLNTFEGELADSDGDGSVDYELGRQLPWRSLWIAVELESGRVVIASPHEPLRELVSARRRAPSEESVEVDAAWLDVLLVRPEGGAWKGRISDGGDGDDDGVPDARR